MLLTLSNLNSNFAVTLGYLNPSLNNLAEMAGNGLKPRCPPL